MVRGGIATLVLALALSGCVLLESEPEAPAAVASVGDEPTSVPQPVGDNLAVVPPRDEAETGPRDPPALPPPTYTVPPLLADGALSVLSLEYDEKVVFVTDGALAPAYTARLHGVAWYPDADGIFPVVALIHGMHGTCDAPPGVGFSEVCDATGAAESIPSYRGYDYLASHLATRGFVVVSIDANQANDRDVLGPFTVVGPSKGTGPEARGDMVLRTLESLAVANESGAGDWAPLRGKLDLSRIGIMGHSRGGEGVSATIAQNAARAEPFAIKAVFALAPTDFGRHDVRGVPFAVLLPSCDGDVSDLQGAWLYDDARVDDESPLHTFTVMGANHNFYNTEWTYDDASRYEDDPLCREKAPARLTDAQQRATGVALMGAFFRAYLQDEAALLPFLSGDAQTPGEMCQDGAGPCPALLHVAYQPGAADRALVDAAEGDGSKNALGGATSFDGFLDHNVCSRDYESDATGIVRVKAGSWCPGRNVHSARMHNLSWSGSATWRTDVGGADWSARRALSLRVAVPPVEDARSPQLRFTLTDAAGASASMTLAESTPALYVSPSTDHAQTVLSTLRLPLAGFVGVDLAHVREVAITFTTPGEGRAVMTDLAVDA